MQTHDEEQEQQGLKILDRIRIGRTAWMYCPHCRNEHLPAAKQKFPGKDIVTLDCGHERQPETLPGKPGAVSFMEVQYNNKRALELWPILPSDNFNAIAYYSEQRIRDGWE